LPFLGLTPLTPVGLPNFTEIARAAAERRGDVFDERTPLQIVEQRRRDGERAFPTLSPAYYLEPSGSKISIDNESVLPLGLVPHAATYYCREGGVYPRFSTDRFGFRNPDLVWDTDTVDLLIIGDSFAMGACLEEPATVVGLMRGTYTRIANLGIGANGPLMALAGVREYGPLARAPFVVWFMTQNSLENLERELQNPILRRYIEGSGFLQDLPYKQRALTSEVERLANEYLAMQHAAASSDHQSTPSWFTIPSIRARIKFLFARAWPMRRTSWDVEAVKTVLKRTDEEARSLGAQLVVAYIPDCEEARASVARSAKKFLAIAAELGIARIDVGHLLPNAHRSGSSPYYYCPGSHFSPKGASLVAESITAQLARLTSNSRAVDWEREKVAPSLPLYCHGFELTGDCAASFNRLLILAR
jgi:hypothetical protein